MAPNERTTRPEAARCEQAPTAQNRVCWGAHLGAPFRGASSHDLHASVRPEDVARSELFYSSTGCWV